MISTQISFLSWGRGPKRKTTTQHEKKDTNEIWNTKGLEHMWRNRTYPSEHKRCNRTSPLEHVVREKTFNIGIVLLVLQGGSFTTPLVL